MRLQRFSAQAVGDRVRVVMTSKHREHVYVLDEHDAHGLVRAVSVALAQTRSR